MLCCVYVLYVCACVVLCANVCVLCVCVLCVCIVVCGGYTQDSVWQSRSQLF